jgi:hypothetical protein
MQAAGYKSSPQNHSGWHQAPDGRRFRVYEGRCVHYDCWQARCGCGHKLTAHDFDADGAYRSALDALSRRDPLDRPDFAHPPEQCHPAPRSRNA